MKRTLPTTPKTSVARLLKPRPLGESLSRLGSIAVISATLLAGSGTAKAVDNDWTAGSSLDFLWSTIANWSLGLPTGAQDLRFLRPIPNPGALLNPETITLGAGSLGNSLSFKGNYTLTGGDLTLTAGAIRADVGTSAIISSQLISTSGFTLTGGGQVKLTNTSNSISGTTTLAGGTLVVSDLLQLGGSATPIVITSGNSVSGNTAVTGFVGGSLFLDGTSSALSLARAIGLEGLGANGRGSALVSLGSNTLSGLVTAGGGATSRSSRLASVNGTLTLSGGLVAAGTNITTFTTLGGNNSVGAGNFNLTGPLTGTGSIEKAGSGALFLNPSVATGFSGTTRISGAAAVNQSSVRVGTATAFGANAGTTSSSTIDMNGGVLEVRSDTALTFAKTVYQRASSTIYTGPAAGGSGVNLISNFNALHVASNTTLTFNSRNGGGVTFTGAQTQENSNNPVTWTNNLGGALLFTASVWPNSDAATARTLTIGGNGNTTITTNIAATGAGVKTVTKTGTGLLTIIGNAAGAGVNGPTNIQGSLAATDFRSISDTTASTQLITLGNTTTTLGNLIIGTSGTSVLANLVSSRPIVFNGTTNNNAIYANQTLGSPVVLNGAITKPLATTANIVLGGTSTQENIINTAIPVTGTGGLIKNGAGLWALSATNLYAGPTTITRGTLRLKPTAGGASDIIPNANALVFNADAVTQDAGGVLELLGANTETLGALTPTAGAGTVRLLTAAASLTFTSSPVPGKGSGVNFEPIAGSTVTLTGVAGSTAITLPGNGHFYIGGADFARSSTVTPGLIVTPAYGTDAGFVNGGAALTAGNHNLVNAVIAAQPAVAVSSLKLTTNNITLAGLLTVNTGGAANDGGILAAGSSTIAGTGITSGGAGTLVFRSNLAANVLTLNAPITATTTGGFTKNGAGVLIIGGANAQSGAIAINEGTVRLGASGVLSAGGASAADLAIRQGAVLDLNGVSSGTAIRSLDGSGSIVNGQSGTPAAATLTLGNNNGTGTFTGIIGNGTGGAVSVTKGGIGGMSWLGNNTYTGVTTIGSTGLVTVNTLALGGVASGIGQSSSAATNLVFNGTTGGLVYAGGLLNGSLSVGSRSATTDRLFTLAGSGATLSSTATNNNAIVWSNTGAIVNTGGANTLLFTGTSTGDNTFNPQLTDTGGVITVTKTAVGQWNLGNTANSYTGLTTVAEGVLGLNDNGALPSLSPLQLGAAATIGQIQMSGSLARTLTATPTAGTGTLTFGGTAGGGFAAHIGKLTVTLDGGAGVTWAGGAGFVPNAATLSLNSTSSLDQVEFTNAINLNGALRTVTVNDNPNTGADLAILSGALSGSGTSGLTKAGTGILQLTSNASSYQGVTAVNAGALAVRSLGLSGVAGTSSVGEVTVGAFTAANAVTLGSGTTGGVLQYTGAGETSDRQIRITSTTGSPQIHADGSGALVLTAVSNNAAGVKGLFLRGSSMAGNTITSPLIDNGGALSLSVDGSATWILTNSGNLYSGGTTAGGGALGIGDNAALGSGALSNSNGSVFAFGADRSIANAVTLPNNTANGWIGDYSLTIGGATNFAAAGNNINTNNNIVAGKALTFNGGFTANALTALRAWVFDGTGETVLNGTFTTSTAFGVRMDVNGGGTLNLGLTAAGSNWNQVAGSGVDVDRGTLKFSANNAIPTTVAASGGVTLSPELVTSDTATLDLNGTTQTLNAFTATTDGTAIITNSAVGPATLIVGANNNNAAFGTGGAGIYSITQPGGVISLTKVGTGTANFTGTLGNTGTITSNGGALNLNSPVLTATAVGDGGQLNFKGGFTTPGNLLSVTTDNGGLVSFANGVGTPFANLTTLNLSLTASSGLELDAGDTAVDFLTTSAASVANVTTLFIKDIDITSSTSYPLISHAGGGLGVLGNYALNLPGYSGSTLTVTPTLVTLNAGTLITSDVYWNNGTGFPVGGVLTQAWNTVDPTTTNINFSGVVGGSPALQLSENLPGKGQKVIFQADNIALSGVPLATTLEQSFTVNAIEFRVSAIAADTSRTISIAPGAVSSNSLTLKPSLSTDGINLQTGAVGTVTISAPFVAGTPQTWTVADAPVELTNGVTTFPATPTIVAVTSTTGLRPGMTITGTGIPANTTIVSVDSPTQVTISNGATAAGTGLNILAAQQLNMSGALSGAGNVAKAGAGKVVLSGASGTLTGTYTTNAGITQVNTLSALGGSVGVPGSGADITVTGGSFFFNGAAATFVNDIALNGGTLASGGGNHTYSGGINVSANSTVSLRDQAAASAAFGIARNVTLSGVVSGASNITIDAVNTVTGGNQTAGTLTLSNVANTWTGDLLFNRGTVSLPTAVSPFLTSNDVTFSAFGRLQLNGADTTTLTRTGTLNFSAGAIGEFSVDNAAATPVGNYTVNQTGAVTLGSGGVGGTARFFLANDNGSNLTITGGVILDGNSSISVTGSDADSLVTISGTGISGTGNLAINDEAGGWGVASSRLAINAAGTYLGNTSLNEGILILGHATALSTGSLTITGASTLQTNTDLTAGSGIANAVVVNAALTLRGTDNFKLSGAISGTAGLTKLDAGTVILSGLDPVAANNYAGLTTLNGGTTVIETTAASLTGGLTIGTAAGTTLSALNLTTGSATFGGATVVQTNSLTPNTVAIGTGQTLRLNGSVVIGTNGASNTRLTASGLGTLTIGAVGSPTNANLTLGNNTTTNVSNGATLDLSGLSTFYANLGTGTLRVGSATNGGGTSTNGASSLILAPVSEILATTITQDSPDGNVTQAIKLGSTSNIIAANTITIGAGANGRTSGTFDFSTGTGTLSIRSFADPVAGRATLNVANVTFGTGQGPSAIFNTTGHSADLRFATVTVASRSANTGGATGTFSFDTGTLDADDLIAGSKLVGSTGGTALGTINLAGGTSAFNSVTGPMVLGTNAVGNGTGSGTLNVSGSAVVTVAANAGTAIALGNASVAAGTATGVVNVTGGSLTVAGNIVRGATTGTSNATVTLNGGTLNVSTFNIGAAAAGLVTFNAQSGTLQNLGELNGGGTLNKTTGGTLLMDTLNSYTGTTTVSNGLLRITHGSALGTTAGGTSVANGATLELSNNITTLAEALTLNGAGLASVGALHNLSGANTYTGAITAATSTTITADAASTLDLTGGIAKNGVTLTFTGGGTANISGVGISGILANSDLVVDGLTLNFGVANDYNGPTIIRSNGGGTGIINANVVNALPTANGRSAVTMDDSGAGSSQLNLGADQSIKSLAGAASSLVSLGANTLTVGTTSGTTTFAGNISGAAGAGLIKDGASTLVLSGTNSYPGDTTVSGGTLSVSGGAAVADAAHVQVGTAAGAIFDVNGDETIGDISGGGAAGGEIVLNATKTLTVNGGSGSTLFNGVVSGAGNLAVSGSGSVTLDSLAAGGNTFTGTATVGGGTSSLTAQNANALAGVTTVAVNTGGTLFLTGANVPVTGTDRINNVAAFTLAGGKIDVGSAQEGNGTLSLAGVGALTLSISSTLDFSGVGTLMFASAGASPNGTLTIANWTGTAFTLGTDGTTDRLIFQGSNANRTAFETNYDSTTSNFIDFGGSFLPGFATIQFNTNYFEVVPVPEPTGVLVGLAMFGLAGMRERRRSNARRREERLAGRN